MNLPVNDFPFVPEAYRAGYLAARGGQPCVPPNVPIERRKPQLPHDQSLQPWAKMTLEAPSWEAGWSAYHNGVEPAVPVPPTCSVGGCDPRPPRRVDPPAPIKPRHP